MLTQGFRDGDGSLLIDYGELGVKSVMGFIAANVPAGPGVQDNSLADLDPGDCGTGIHHDPQGITAGDMDGCRISSAENWDRKSQGGEIGIIIGSRSQNRRQNTTGIVFPQLGGWNRFQPDHLFGRAVIVSVNGQGLHALGYLCADKRGCTERPTRIGIIENDWS